MILCMEEFLIDIFSIEEDSITWIGDSYFLEHLTDDDLDVSVIDVYTLEAIDFLDLVHEISLEFTDAADFEDLLRNH